MNQERWTAVDGYVCDLLISPDDALDAALRASAAAGLPSINVTPPQGKFLHLLARLQQSRRILEIGTLGGYSTIWLARALPADGRLITLEYSPAHAAVAQANIARAGLSNIVQIIVGRAIETLPPLAGQEPFDFVFIDADKVSTADYFAWAIRLGRRGSVIIVDNVVREGSVIDAASSDAAVQGIRRFNQMLAAEKRVSATTLQTVGSKGYDGFTMAVMV